MQEQKDMVGVLCALFIAAFIFSPSQKNRFRIKSKILAERRTVLIHHPKGYEDSGESYPVLYCLDAVHRISTFGPSSYSFFTKELIPYVDQKYRTSNFRILYGRSDSGLFALFALLDSPDTFSAVISSSPTIGLSPKLLKTKTFEMFQMHPHLNNRLYIIYGDNDIPLAKDFIPDFVHTVRSHQNPEFNCEAKVISDGGHIPESSLFHGLRFIFNH